MNVFKYIWLKLKDYFNSREYLHETYEEYQERTNKYIEKFINQPPSKEVSTNKFEAVVGAFDGKPSKILQDQSPQIIKEWREERFKELSEKFPLDLPPKEKDPARWEINEKKPKRSYNRATKQQVARIKLLVGRGKPTKQIAKDVGLPYDNVNYYVKKFGG